MCLAHVNDQMNTLSRRNKPVHFGGSLDFAMYIFVIFKNIQCIENVAYLTHTHMRSLFFHSPVISWQGEKCTRR